MLRKTIRNIVWMSGDQVLRLAVSFFVGAWIARYLEPAQYGLLNYGLAFVALFTPLANLADLNQILIRDITRDPNSKNNVLGSTFVLKFIGSLGAVALSIGLAFVVRPNDELAQSIIILLSITTLCFPFTTIDSWFQSKLEIKYAVISKNIVFVIATLLRIGLIYNRAPLITFAGVIALETVFSSAALIVAYRIDGFKLQDWQPKLATTKRLLGDGWAIILSSFAISIYLKIDLAMLGPMAGDYSVGIYSVAVRLSELCSFLPSAIVSSSMLAVIAAKERDESEFYSKLQKLFDLITLLALCFAVFMSLFSPVLIQTVYGDQYVEASNLVIVHVWSLFFMCFGFTRYIWVIAENKGNYTLISTSFSALLNVILNLLLIPKYQAMGAAVATLISYGFNDYITCFIYPPARKIGWMITRSLFANSLVLAPLKRLLRAAG
jgi:polysaccharide transporter, PST family